MQCTYYVDHPIFRETEIINFIIPKRNKLYLQIHRVGTISKIEEPNNPQTRKPSPTLRNRDSDSMKETAMAILIHRF